MQSFYQTYYMMIVQHVLSVVTDTSHTAGNYKSANKISQIMTVAWPAPSRLDSIVGKSIVLVSQKSWIQIPFKPECLSFVCKDLYQ